MGGGLTPSPLLFSPYCVKFLPLPLPTFLFKSFVYYYYYSYFFSVDFFTLSFTPHRIICLYNFIFLNSFPPFLWIILILLLLFFSCVFFPLEFRLDFRIFLLVFFSLSAWVGRFRRLWRHLQPLHLYCVTIPLKDKENVPPTSPHLPDFFLYITDVVQRLQ